jgi:predicted ester cyclase
MTATITTSDRLQANKALVGRMIDEEFNSGGDIANEIIHPRFVDHTNPPGMQHGIAGHQAIVALFRGAFPDMRWRVEDSVAESDRVVVRLSLEATHTGAFFGIPATGRPIRVQGVHILRIADGRLAEHWGSNDDLGLMRQLGAIEI